MYVVVVGVVYVLFELFEDGCCVVCGVGLVCVDCDVFFGGVVDVWVVVNVVLVGVFCLVDE